MDVADYGADYETTVAALARYLRRIPGSDPGDPNRAARAILKITETAEPPLCCSSEARDTAPRSSSPSGAPRAMPAGAN